jgi:hypothetical protein
MPFIYNTGGGGAVGDTMTKDDLTNQINGSLQQFTTSNTYQTGSLRVYLNGLYLRSGLDYEELTSSTFRLLLITPAAGEDLVVEYIEL